MKNSGLIAGRHHVFLECLTAALLPPGAPVPVGKVKPLPPPVAVPPPARGPALSPAAPAPRFFGRILENLRINPPAKKA